MCHQVFEQLWCAGTVCDNNTHGRPGHYFGEVMPKGDPVRCDGIRTRYGRIGSCGTGLMDNRGAPQKKEPGVEADQCPDCSAVTSLINSVAVARALTSGRRGVVRRRLCSRKDVVAARKGLVARRRSIAALRVAARMRAAAMVRACSMTRDAKSKGGAINGFSARNAAARGIFVMSARPGTTLCLHAQRQATVENEADDSTPAPSETATGTRTVALTRAELRRLHADNIIET
ncbi:hypothetical protein GGS21DRAFT_485690 [Xylaria nigripes]|nr:hypothetical protein GGS21DRAFT_485690 [Xylaria nigripes]